MATDILNLIKAVWAYLKGKIQLGKVCVGCPFLPHESCYAYAIYFMFEVARKPKNEVGLGKVCCSRLELTFLLSGISRCELFSITPISSKKSFSRGC